MRVGITDFKGKTKICKHRWGADMTFSFQSDEAYIESGDNVEYLGFVHGMRLGCFTFEYIANSTFRNITTAEQTGVIRHDIYFSTDRWWDGSGHNIIPDYYETAWTAAGVAVFPNAVLGATKATRYPNHGQEMYDISGGAFGHDYVNGVAGTNNNEEYLLAAQYQIDWLHGQISRYSLSGSFRNSQAGGSVLSIFKMLGMRNGNGGNQTAFNDMRYGDDGIGDPMAGLNRLDFSSYAPTTRFMDTPEAGRDAWYTQNLLDCIANKGWFRDFAHWHSEPITGIDHFMNLTKTTLAATNVWFCSNSEALEYMYARELTDCIQVKEVGNTLELGALTHDKFKTGTQNGISTKTPTIGINTPICVEIDVTGTVLEGKQVKSNIGKILNPSTDVYIVEVPFTKFGKCVLSEAANGIHNTNVPSVVSYSGGVLTTDMPTRAVLFQTTGGTFNVSLVERSNVLSTTHNFTGSGDKIGIISEYGKLSIYTI